jgi:hypothetical protein
LVAPYRTFDAAAAMGSHMKFSTSGKSFSPGPDLGHDLAGEGPHRPVHMFGFHAGGAELQADLVHRFVLVPAQFFHDLVRRADHERHGVDAGVRRVP